MPPSATPSLPDPDNEHRLADLCGSANDLAEGYESARSSSKFLIRRASIRTKDKDILLSRAVPDVDPFGMIARIALDLKPIRPRS
jgi:hypothetical protein